MQRVLKAWGSRVKAPNWQRFGTQAWRRGMAADRARKAKSLQEILDGGDWSEKSRTYLTHIRSAYDDLDARVASAVLVQESDEE